VALTHCFLLKDSMTSLLRLLFDKQVAECDDVFSLFRSSSKLDTISRCVCVRETERERETHTHRERERETEKERKRAKERERERMLKERILFS
jgi:hypothetical protein